MSITDLDSYFKRYGDWWCNKNGGSCDSISYYEDSYPQYKLVVSDVTTEYYNDPIVMLKPQIGAQQEITNNTSLEQSQTVTMSKTTTNSFSWSLSESIKVSISTKFAVGVPPIAEAETTITTDLTLSSSQQHVETESRTWTIVQPVRVSPHTKVNATLLIDERKFSQRFHTKCTFGGYVCTKSPDRINGHYYWFHPVASIFSTFPQDGFTVDGNLVHYQGDGIFQGVMGVRAHVLLKETSLIQGPSDPIPWTPIVPPIKAGISGLTDCRNWDMCNMPNTSPNWNTPDWTTPDYTDSSGYFNNPAIGGGTF